MFKIVHEVQMILYTFIQVVWDKTNEKFEILSRL